MADFNPIQPGLFWGALARGKGGGDGGARSPYLETIHGIEMKFCRVVENHKLINLV